MPLFKNYILSVSCLLLAFFGHAQYLKVGTHARMDELEVRPGYRSGNFQQVRPNESFGQKLVIVNNSDQPARFRLSMRDNRFFRMVYSTGSDLVVPAHDSVAVGLKFLNVNARVNGMYTIYVDLQNLDDETDKKAYEFHIEVFDGSDRAVYVQPLQENIYLEKKVKGFEVPVLLRNLLPDATTVHFEVQNPVQSQYIIGPAFQKGVRIPGKDTVVNLQMLYPSQLFEINRSNTSMTLYVKNDRGDLLGMFTVYPRMLTNMGDMMNMGFDNVTGSGFMARMDFMSFGNGNYATGLQVLKPAKLNDHFGFGVNYMGYSSGYHILSNTYLDLVKEEGSVRIGNIGEVHELSLLGRGLKGQMFFEGDRNSAVTGDYKGERSQSLEVWAVDGEFNLLRPFSLKTGSKTLSARYNFQTDNANGFSWCSNYFMRNYSNSNGHLHFGTWKSQLTERQSISVMLSGSQEFFHHPHGDTTLFGYAGKVDYVYNGPKLNIYGMVQHSSRNYSGVMQGVTLANVLVGYPLGKRTMIAYSILNYTVDKPTYTDSTIAGRLYSDMHQQGIQFTYRKPKASVYLKPYLMRQGFFYSPTLSSANGSHATSLRATLGFTISGRGYLVNGSADGGFMKGYMRDRGYFTTPVTKFNLAASSHGFTVQGSFQTGPYYLNELSFVRNNPAAVYLFNGSAMYILKIRKKFDLITTVMALKTNFNQNIQSTASQNLNYSFGKGFIASARVAYTSIGDQHYVQAGVGLQKNFDWFGGPESRVRLRMRVYFDRNYNGVRDAGEDWAPGLVFKFDDLHLVTGADGTVEVQNIEKGWHKFSIYYKNGGDQSGQFDQKLEIDHNSKLDIGVPPQFELSGHVVEETSQYLQKADDLSGIKISIRNGSNEYFVYTQSDGSFRLILRPGRYKVAIDQFRQLGIPDAEKEVVINPEKGMVGKLELTWKNTIRKVDVKKIEKKQ